MGFDGIWWEYMEDHKTSWTFLGEFMSLHQHNNVIPLWFSDS